MFSVLHVWERRAASDHVFRPQMKQQQSVLEVQLTPFNILLRAVLSQLQEKDHYSIFAQPVCIKEVRLHESGDANRCSNRNNPGRFNCSRAIYAT